MSQSVSEAVIVGPDPARYRPHDLHAAERRWPETNCYVDLWIEVLSALGCEPRAMLGFTVAQDFEGDQFTFFKVPLEDLETLYGLRVTELAIYDRAEDHIAAQVRRGRLCLVEVDSFFLPDTGGVAYRREHAKTTIAVNRLDRDGRRLDYFHNGGYFTLAGEDYEGVFEREGDPQRPFLPYTEFVKLAPRRPAGDLRSLAGGLLSRRLANRPGDNPVRAFQQVFASQAEALAERPFAAFHKYAFNTLRQLGANYELLGDHLLWLDGAGYGAAIAACDQVAETAKSAQFQLARALTRRRFDALSQALQPAVDAYDELFLSPSLRRAA